ncbi:MFS transporter [Candidatus Parcubacteria bacterium]|nr:MFS transporter [Candidatus Parcubacteria bacterium]
MKPTETKNVLGVPRNVFFLGLTSLLNDASSEMIFPLIPLFLTTVLNASFKTVGLIEGVAEATASLAKIPAGWLSDKFKNRKGLTVLGYSLSAVVKPLLAFATLPGHVLAVRFTDRLGKGVRTAPRDALIASSTATANYGRSFGFHRTMDTIGAVVGPLLAAALLPLFGFRNVFLLSFVASAVAVLNLMVFVREVRGAPSPIAPDLRRQLGGLRSRKIFTPRFTMFLIAATLFAIGNSSDAFLLLRARDAGVPAYAVPLAYVLFNVVYASLAVPAGIASDRFGRRRLLAAGFVIFSLVYLGFAVVSSPALIWPLFACYGFYAAIAEGTQRAFVADVVSEENRGAAFGLFAACVGLALLPASLIAGFLWDRFGPAAPFAYGAATSAAAAGLMLFVPYRKPAAASRP